MSNKLSSWLLSGYSPALPAGDYATRRRSAADHWGARAILISEGHVVLVQHHVPEHHEPFYLFPGGGVEIGETIAEAAARECREETGLIVEIASLIYVREARPGELEFYVLARRLGGDLTLGSDPEIEKQVLVGVAAFPLEQISRMDRLTLYPRTIQSRLERDERQGWPAGLYLGACS